MTRFKNAFSILYSFTHNSSQVLKYKKKALQLLIWNVIGGQRDTVVIG